MWRKSDPRLTTTAQPWPPSSPCRRSLWNTAATPSQQHPTRSDIIASCDSSPIEEHPAQVAMRVYRMEHGREQAAISRVGVIPPRRMKQYCVEGANKSS